MDTLNWDNGEALEWLESEAIRLNKKYWMSDEIPTIVIDDTKEYWKQREDKSGTNILATYFSSTKSIHFNRSINKQRSKRHIRGTLLHELCHYNLHIKNKPYGDEDVEFALELIRVRAGKTCNEDKESINAMKKARKIRREQNKRRVFELRDYEYDIDIKLRHRKKTRCDFKEDVKDTLIRIYNDTNTEEGIDTFVGFSLEDLADMLVEWHGYELVKESIIESVTLTSLYDGNIGDRESVLDSLTNLGMDWEEAESILVEEKMCMY